MSEPIREKDYFQAVEQFLRTLDPIENVTAVAMVALTDDPDCANVESTWSCGPFELVTMAGVLNLSAAKKYIELNEEEDDTDG